MGRILTKAAYRMRPLNVLSLYIVCMFVLGAGLYTGTWVHAQVPGGTCLATVTGEIEARVNKADYPSAVIQNPAQAIAILAADICAANETAFDSASVTDAELLGKLLEAQTRTSAGGGVLPGEYGGTARPASCFSYYGFGSVIPHLSLPINTVVPGTTLYVTGSIENANAYPVVDGTLYIKVFKRRGSGEEKDIDGPDVVDQFVAADNIAIAGRGSSEISFSWDVPTYMQSGEYELATFFTTSKRYNLMGLSFTDDVVGTTVPFTVESDRTTGVGFVKDAVQIGGRKYAFAAYTPHVPTDAPVTITAVLANTTNQTARVPVSWQLYRWDSQRRENLLLTESEEVSIDAGGSTEVSYTITDTTQPVYLLVVKADYGDTHSILNIRFVRDGVEGARINFPSLTSFPLLQGEEATIFSCMHSMSTPVTDSNELVLTVFDRDGNELYSTNYIGSITGEVMGMMNTFVPRRNYDYVELVAQLFTDGVLVEDARLVYDCETLGNSVCLSDAGDTSYMMYGLYAAVGLGALVVLGGIAVAYIRIKKRSTAHDTIYKE